MSVSLWADTNEYKCPECKKTLDRDHRHGWFYRCHKCQKTYPRYVLEGLEKEKAKKKEDSHGEGV